MNGELIHTHGCEDRTSQIGNAASGLAGPLEAADEAQAMKIAGTMKARERGMTRGRSRPSARAAVQSATHRLI